MKLKPLVSSVDAPVINSGVGFLSFFKITTFTSFLRFLRH